MMIKKLLALSISLTFSIAPSLTHAKGNITKGKSLAVSCSSCHGEQGNSMVPSFPKLAGQHASYLEQQLKAFKDGTRNAPMMAPLAMGLNDQSIKDIAAYYSSQKISSNLLPILEIDDDDDDDENENQDNSEEVSALIALGADLYQNGNLETKVSACIACHGPSGEGNKPSSFPSLQGQHADYLIKSLTNFKKGTRNKSSDNMMHMIAKKMTEKEIQAISFYISMLK